MRAQRWHRCVSGWLLVPATDPVGKAVILKPAPKVRVHLVGLIAVHDFEMRMRRRDSTVALMLALGWADAPLVLDIARPPAELVEGQPPLPVVRPTAR